MDSAAEGDTIFALATPPGRSGVAVIRLSGPGAGAAVSRLTAGPPPAPRRARLSRFHGPQGEIIDEGLLLWFPGPRSFTGEDVAELQVHGGRAVPAAMIEALSGLPGLRPAEAGEFTRRAFHNGKLDLLEVEGLADLVDAETEAQRRQAQRQMSGAFSRRLEDWGERLLRALAQVEAEIDFPDEEVPDGQAWAGRETAAAVAAEIAETLADAGRGERLRDGLMVAIVGAPNVGKSSLLNALARRDAAIVAAGAGTTRDVIEVHLDLDGLPVTLADTAGLRELPADVGGGSGDAAAVEAEGMRRSRERAAGADLKLAVFDLRCWPDLDRETAALVDDDSLVVLNKADLVSEEELSGAADRSGGGEIGWGGALRVSARSGAGLDLLLIRLREAAAARMGFGGAVAGITRARHRRALEDCRSSLARAAAGVEAELLAEDLRLALRSLGRLTGRVDVEDILDVVFRDFCIGK